MRLSRGITRGRPDAACRCEPDEIVARLKSKEREEMVALRKSGRKLHPPSVPLHKVGLAPRRPPKKKGHGRN